MMRRAALAAAILLLGTCLAAQAQQAPKIYNTAKQKLLDGKQVVGGTVYSPDPNMYCAMANAGLRFPLDRDAAQPARLPGRGAHDLRL